MSTAPLAEVFNTTIKMADGATGVDVSWLRHSHKGTLPHLHYPHVPSQTFHSRGTLNISQKDLQRDQSSV